jgi:hypothetical protein
VVFKSNIKHSVQAFLFVGSVLIFIGCITQFIPQTKESQQMIVVEGLITDQPGKSSIMISQSLPLGGNSSAGPLKGCIVSVSNDMGDVVSFIETDPGSYLPPDSFIGEVGRSYTLHISRPFSPDNLHYESLPVEMKPVPAIDSVYWAKKTITPESAESPGQEGCQIYLDTHDPSGQCRYFRWEYVETWEIVIPYTVTNKFCWVSANSSVINIKNTSILGEDRINQYPLNFISNLTDRLQKKYSILVKQYSLTEDEYLYWEKLQLVSQQVGNLYDIIPAYIPNNISCLDNVNEKVLGYFSVSSSSTKRIFIKDHFAGLVNQYPDSKCINDTVYNGGFIPSLGTFEWIIINHPGPPSPSYVVTTREKGCADCTVRGTNIPPDFWVF